MDTGAFRVVSTEEVRRRVLVVGGSKLVRKGIAKAMTGLGFESSTALAGEFESTDLPNYDLILAFIDLDSLDGYAILDELTRPGPILPLIAVGTREARGRILGKLLGRPLAYIALPLHGADLQEAIDRVLAPVPSIDDANTERWEEPWQRPDIRIGEVLDSLREGDVELPAIGPVAAQLQSLLRRPTAGVEETVAVVQQDPAIAAGVLRLANSTRYRAIVPITTLRNACLRLGNKTVVALAQETVLKDLFAVGGGPVQRLAHSMWESVIVTSQGARLIAIEKGIPGPDEVQVAAMLHNLGELVLLRATAGLYRDPTKWENSIFLASLGREVSKHHEEVGGLLLRNWGLEEPFIKVAEHHHNPDAPELSERERTLCRVVLAAWAGAEQSGFGWRLGGRRTRSRGALRALHLTSSDLKRIFEPASTWL